MENKELMQNTRILRNAAVHVERLITILRAPFSLSKKEKRAIFRFRRLGRQVLSVEQCLDSVSVENDSLTCSGESRRSSLYKSLPCAVPLSSLFHLPQDNQAIYNQLLSINFYFSSFQQANPSTIKMESYVAPTQTSGKDDLELSEELCTDPWLTP